MIPKDTVDQIRELKAQGINEAEITILTGHSRWVVRKAAGTAKGRLEICDKLSVRERQKLLSDWICDPQAE